MQGWHAVIWLTNFEHILTWSYSLLGLHGGMVVCACRGCVLFGVLYHPLPDLWAVEKLIAGEP